MLDDGQVESLRRHLLKKARADCGPLTRLRSNPRECLITEVSDSDFARAACTGQPLRAWLLDADGMREVPPDHADHNQVETGQTNRYRQGWIGFHIDRELGRVTWNRLFGPRCGSGMVYDAKVTGSTVLLKRSTKGGTWIA